MVTYMRLFLLAPRPKSHRHHINKGWAWFEAKAHLCVVIMIDDEHQEAGDISGHISA